MTEETEPPWKAALRKSVKEALNKTEGTRCRDDCPSCLEDAAVFLAAVLPHMESSYKAGGMKAAAGIAELEDAAYGDATVRLLEPVDQIKHLHASVAAQMSRADMLGRLCREQRERADKADARIAELEKRSARLAALEAAGVDNWEGYSNAFAEDVW